MKNKLNFQTPKNFSKLVEDNELFSHYLKTNYPYYYDLNFIQLHFNPTKEEFVLLEEILKEYQHAEGQNHLKFYWPENTGLFIEVLEYLSVNSYELGKLELLHVSPNQFTQTSSNSNVSLHKVSLDSLESFIALNYQDDLAFGKEFALNKCDFYREQFQLPDVSFWLAFIEDEPVGALILVSSEHFLEVDNLLTAASWRKQGIASELLAYVVKMAAQQEKEVILLADAEDTPREMYLKQGFEVMGSQIHVLKEL